MHEEIFGQFAVESLYIQQVFEHYRAQYLASKRMQLFVENSGGIPSELKQQSYIGLCDRTLGLKIPSNRTQSGGVIRGHLQRAGLLITSGGELFRGCIVFAKTDEFSHFVSAVGYRFGRIRDGQQGIIRWCKSEPDAYIQQGLAQIQEVAYAKAYH